MSSKHRPLAVSAVVAVMALGVVWLANGAAAQEDSEASQESSPPGVLGEMLEERAEGNEEAVEVQKQIDTLSDDTSELLAKYRTTIKQIEAIDLYNAQMRDMIASQERELASLRDQVDRVEEVSRSVTPLMIRMIAAIEKFVQLDVPFLLAERTERIEDLKSMMDRADVSTSEKFRQIMEVYQTEIEFGRTIEAYKAPLRRADTEETVDFLRFGRIALVYLTLDESEAGVWSQEDRGWRPVDPGLYSSIREGLRIARKQTAPDLIKLPLPAATDLRGES